MKEKSKVLSLVLICVGLVFLGGCADTTLTETAPGHVMINAPVNKVFEYITADDADWDPNLKEITNREGKGVGATSNWAYEVGGQEYRGEGVTIEFVPNRKLVTKTSGEIDSTWTWLFVPRGNQTKLVVVVEYSLQMPKAVSVAKDIFAKELDDNADVTLQDIKKKIEQQ
jgi:uncharacterized protein YndB with AHSA1/START domain